MAESTSFPAIVVEELVGAVPSLIERTRAQVDLTQRLIGRLPCLLRRMSPAPSDTTRRPVAPDTAGNARSITVDDSADAIHELHPTPTAGSADAVPTGPAVSELAIPDYDSLAASQVVPRLSSLDADELDDVGAYERSHRGRQTILNRVRQLQAAGER